MWPFWPLILNAGMHLSRWGVVLNLRKNLYHFPYIMRSSEVNDTLEGYQWFIFKKIFPFLMSSSYCVHLFLICTHVIMFCYAFVIYALPFPFISIVHLFRSRNGCVSCTCFLWFALHDPVILVVNLLLHSPCLNHAFSFT